MANTMVRSVVETMAAEALRVLKHDLVMAKQLNRFWRVIRVRRRGFRRDVRRGDDLRWSASSDGTARVVRRSNHHLWLEIDRPDAVYVGDTVRIRLPSRYQ